MVAVALGGVVGCLVRGLLSPALNRYFPLIPPGTLAANLIGGYIIGAAFALFTLNPAMPVEWRLFFLAGFCGGVLPPLSPSVPRRFACGEERVCRGATSPAAPIP